MKRIFTTTVLLILGILAASAQSDTTEVNRIVRRINNFDLYDKANQTNDSIVEAIPAVNEKSIEGNTEVSDEFANDIPAEVLKVEVRTKKIAKLESSLSDGSYYTVQVAASRTPLSQEYLGYRNYVEIYGSDGWYRYFSSRFLSLEKAKIYSYQIQNTTKFKEAFPVRLKDYVKVNLYTGLR